MRWGWQPYPVTRLRPALVADGHGGLRSDWTHPNRADVGGWKWAPKTQAVEDVSDRQHGVEIVGQLIREGVADVKPGDVVEFELGRFQVVGQPQEWRPGTVLDVGRWDG